MLVRVVFRCAPNALLLDQRGRLISSGIKTELFATWGAAENEFELTHSDREVKIDITMATCTWRMESAGAETLEFFFKTLESVQSVLTHWRVVAYYVTPSTDSVNKMIERSIGQGSRHLLTPGQFSLVDFGWLYDVMIAGDKTFIQAGPMNRQQLVEQIYGRYATAASSDQRVPEQAWFAGLQNQVLQPLTSKSVDSARKLLEERLVSFGDAARAVIDEMGGSAT